MKYSHSLVTIIGLIGIGVAAIVVGALRTSSEAPPADRDRAANRPVRATMPEPPRLPEPGAKLPLPSSPTHGHVPTGPAEETSRLPVAGGARAALDTRAEQEREYRAYMAGVDAAFRAEPTDPPWSSATSLIVRTALSGDGDLRRLARNVECHSRTCRVEIADDGPGKLGVLLPMFTQQVGDQLPSAVADRIVNPAGGATIVLYMSRNSETQATPRR